MLCLLDLFYRHSFCPVIPKLYRPAAPAAYGETFMSTRTFFSLLTLAALGLAAAHPAAAQSTITLTNGGFNGNNDSNGVYNFSGSQSYGYAYGNHYAQYTPGSDFERALYINGGSVYQLLGHTGAAGEILTLTGSLLNYNTTPPGSVIEFTSAAPTSSDDLASGSILASESLVTPPSHTSYNFAPLSYTATAANQDIYLVIGGPSIADYGQYGAQTNYANFSLADIPAPPPSAAPEPAQAASFGFVVLGVSGLLFAAKKRRASQMSF